MNKHKHGPNCDHDHDDDEEDDGIDWETPLVPIQNETRKIGRNEPCPCGSGKKYKKCHIDG
jgi:uncharacterized protein YecA (UPF0149 family)